MQVKIFSAWKRKELEDTLNSFLRGLPFSDVVDVSLYPPQRLDDKGTGWYAVVQLRADAPIKEKSK